jgi:plasmid replication initiation protein
MKSELVVKDNALINASYSLNLIEQRLVLLAIVVMRLHNKELSSSSNRPIQITAESYINTFGVTKQTAYQALKDACKTLFARQFSYQESRTDGIAYKTTRWVSDIAYIDNLATIEFTFSPTVLPLITHLEKHLTSYELRQITDLSSVYAIRLYEMLISWKKTGKTPSIKLNDFRKKLGVLDNEYQRMDNFKRIVLLPAIEQINKHTDITVSYEQHKIGKIITDFSFSFKSKNKKEESKKPSAKELKILGVPKSEIEKQARPGESYEVAAVRIKAELKNTSSKERARQEIKAMKEILAKA